MRLSCDPNEILWYAMSSPFRREMKAKALLDAHHIENFIPMKKRQEIRDGEIVTWEEPAIHNFVFVHDSYNGINLWLLPASEGGEGQAFHSVDRRFDSNGMQRGV